MSPQSLKPGWKMVKFGEVVRQCKESVDRDNNPFGRYVEGGHMDSDNIHIRRWGEFGADYVGPAFHRIFRKGQVLYGSRRTYLKKVAVADFDGITANTTFVCETKDKSIFMQELLPFLMLTDSFTEHSIRESKGSTNPYINWPDIAKYEFPLPPLDEQKRIAEILWAADEAICSQRSLVSDVRNAQAVFFDSRMKADSANQALLGNALQTIVAGKSPQGASRPANDDEFGVLKVSAVGNDCFVETENKALVKQADFNDEYEVKTGFILVTRANALPSGVGRPCVVKNVRPGLMLSDKTLRLVPNEETVFERFLYQNLLSRNYRKYVETAAGGTEAKNISQDRLKKAPIWLPSLETQQAVTKTLLSFDQTIERAEASLDNSQSMLRALNSNWVEVLHV
ncbi:MAG: restriction endonuclease subunit S [Synergistaceae bacterium]|nr:restriction endonuclease subunit S [Synergistaceae bacterium]